MDKKCASMILIIHVPYIHNNERIIINKKHIKCQLNHLVKLITDDRNIRLSNLTNNHPTLTFLKCVQNSLSQTSILIFIDV